MVADYVLEPHHVKLLTMAAECWDRSANACAQIRNEGAVILDRFGQRVMHPAVRIEKDSKALFARLLRELALDIAEPDVNRPPPAPTRGPDRTQRHG